MNRVVIQEGYSMPVAFDGVRRRKSSGGRKAQQNKFKACAKQWSGKGKYVAHMKKCLKSK